MVVQTAEHHGAVGPAVRSGHVRGEHERRTMIGSRFSPEIRRALRIDISATLVWLEVQERVQGKGATQPSALAEIVGSVLAAERDAAQVAAELSERYEEIDRSEERRVG